VELMFQLLSEHVKERDVTVLGLLDGVQARARGR